MGFLGVTEVGPATPTLVTSHAAFTRQFGSDVKGDGSPRYLAHAVAGFFENKGSRCFIQRVGDNSGILTEEHFTLGLRALEDVPEVALLACPDEHTFANAGIARALVEQCERLKNRFAILSAPYNASPVTTHQPSVQSACAAYYYPWLRVKDSRKGVDVDIPPHGHIAGIFARVDERKGVHKAPAGESIQGVSGLQLNVTDEQQKILQPRGVNVLRTFAGRGHVVWGARTTSADPLWRYVNVRRLFIFVEQSIEQGMQWAVFEINNAALWTRVIRQVSEFLIRLWRNGAFPGAKPEEAFFVKCDQTTMTQDDIDNGRLICLIGIAPVRPSEFVIFRISQQCRGI